MIGRTAHKVSGVQGPLISVITPSFNQGKFIEQTIRSVVEQPFSGCQYIVVDGGSRDETARILEQYRDRIDTLIIGPDGGQADAINTGLRHAEGEIIAYLNSDDLYQTGTLATVSRLFAQYPDIDILHGDCLVIDSASEPLTTYRSCTITPYMQMRSNRIYQPATFWRRSVYEVLGPFNEGYNYLFDYEYWMRALLKRLKFFHVPTALASFRLHEASKTSTALPAFNEERQRLLLERYSEIQDLVGKPNARRVLAGHYLKSGNLLANIDRTSALRYYRRAVGHDRYGVAGLAALLGMIEVLLGIKLSRLKRAIVREI